MLQQQEVRWQAKIQRIKDDLEEIKGKDFGALSNTEFRLLVRLLERSLADTDDLYSSIAIKQDEQRDTRNSYYALCLSSAVGLGVTVLRWYVLHDYGLAAADKWLLGVSAGAELLAGGTSFYLGWEYNQEVQRFGALLNEALQISTQMHYYYDLLDREQQNRDEQ